jgi:hypothetical protein
MVFTDVGQAAYIRYVPMSPKPNLTGRMITAWVYVESTTVAIQIEAYAQSLISSSAFLGGSSVTVNPGDTPTWIMLTMVIPFASSSWDPTQINQFGISFTSTGNVADAGSTTVIAVDDFSVQ